MGKVLIIGAGGVGNVVAYKCAQHPEVFSDITLASRRLNSCDRIKKNIRRDIKRDITTAEVNADHIDEVIRLIEKSKAEIVINVALPYQDLSVMHACLHTNTNYLDTANFEPRDEAKFEYRWQWPLKDLFEKRGITAVLGCGFDPGVTGVFTAYAKKHHFDHMRTLDIVDCNAGDHRREFATNFDPEINIREITQNGRYWENGKWVETKPLETHKPIAYPQIGEKESYVLYHEELESIVKNFPELERARFWMTFGEKYLGYLRMLVELGLSRIDKIQLSSQKIFPREFMDAINIDYEGLPEEHQKRLEAIGMTDNKAVDVGDTHISPLRFISKYVLPDPGSLAAKYTGSTSIGCQITGTKSGKEKTYYIYNNKDHKDCYREVRAQGISYTTGVPAMLGAMMVMTGKWSIPGVFNTEEFDPDPFIDGLNKNGLPVEEVVDQPLPVESLILK